MSRTIETSGAALAALCIAGMPSQANATVVTVNDFLAYNSGTDTPLSIDSSTANFFYNSYFFYGQKADFGSTGSGLTANNGVNGSATTDPYVGGYTPYSSYTVSNDSGTLQGTGYIQFSLFNDHGDQEYGYASFDSAGDLLSYTYETAAATPLPAAWAMFVGGTAMLGLVARRRRKAAA